MLLLKEFDAWESMANKTHRALKMFIHKAYRQRLTALELRGTSGQNGYTSQTIFNVLEGDDDTDANTVTTITQTAAMTAASTIAMAVGTSEVTSNAYSLTINGGIAVQSTSFRQTRPPSRLRWRL
jgi:hypothetical protein